MFKQSLSIGLLGMCASIILGAGSAYPAALGVSKEAFGKMADGTPVEKYTLANVHGMEVSIITYGGAVQSIKVPDKDGKPGDVALGFDNLADYLKDNNPYFGALIGRYGNRIAKGQFVLDGKTYQIPANNGPNALHGGPKGFDKQVWSATSIADSGWVGVELTYFSPDGQMGFPGNLAVTVRYTPNNDNEQLKNAEPKQGGYDHNWVFDNPGNLSALAVRVFDPKSGRAVEMYTTEPGVQFYVGNFLDGSLKGKDGLTYEHWGAFTLEAQHYPDSPNQATFPSTELKAGEKYSQTTIYKFLPL